MADLQFPTQSDYRRRIERAQLSMAEAGLDLLALSSFDNHRFFGGVDGIATVRPVWLVLPRTGVPAFVSPRIEAPEIRAQTWIPVTDEWVEWEEPENTPVSFIAAQANCVNRVAPTARSIGVDFDATSATNLERLRVAFGSERIQDVSVLVREVRRKKDRATIDVVRRCADIAAAQFVATCE